MEPRRAPRSSCMVVYAHYPEDPRVRREAEALARHGIRVTVVCLQQPGEPATDEVAGVRVKRLPLRRRRGGLLSYAYQFLGFFVLASLAVRRLQARDGAEIVHVHSLPDILAFAALPARLRGARLILDLHEVMPELVAARVTSPWRPLLVPLVRGLETLSCLIAHRTITVGDSIATLLCRRGVPRERITVVTNVPTGTPPLGVAAVPQRLVFAGTVHPDRDLETFLRALALLPTLELRVFGPEDPTYSPILRRSVEELDLSARVSFHGPIPPEAVAREIAASAVGVVTYVENPHTRIGLSSKAFEFAAVRRPLVITDLPGLRALFDGAAQFYPAGDAKALADRIQKASEGGGGIEAQVERAATILERHAWPVMEQRLVQLYAGLVREDAP